MRTAFLAVFAAVLFTSVGCHFNLAPNKGGCNCRNGHGGGLAGHGGGGHRHGHGAHGLDGGLLGTSGGSGHTRVAPMPHGLHDYQSSPANGGPAGPTVAYPYYTVRGPRDFLTDDPPTIGY